MKTLMVFLLCSSFYASAQSWQIGGSTHETSLSQSGSSLAYKVYLTVSDDKGLPVTGLKAADFAAWGEICNAARNCDFNSMSIVNTPQGIFFKERLPGFYIMTFRFDLPSFASVSSHRLLLRASTWTVSSNYKKVPSHYAQILLQVSSN